MPILKADGFDHCVIGILLPAFGMLPRLVYDYDSMIEELGKSMTAEEAVEYFEFNIIGAYVGEQGPLFIQRRSPELSLDDWVDEVYQEDDYVTDDEAANQG